MPLLTTSIDTGFIIAVLLIVLLVAVVLAVIRRI